MAMVLAAILFDPLREQRNTGLHIPLFMSTLGMAFPCARKAARTISKLVPVHFGGPCREVNVTNGEGGIHTKAREI
jgi:hypothetical protein